MPMNIHKQQLLILTLHDNLLNLIYLRIQYFVGILPLSIEIHSSKRTSVTAIYHPIRVQHRHDLNDELVTQLLGVGMVAECSHKYERRN